MEKEEGEQNNDTNSKKSSVVIRIPSYQEVVESSQAKSTPPSLFVPSQTFSEAFAFLKSSEFYSPPPSFPRYTHLSPLLLLKAFIILVIIISILIIFACLLILIRETGQLDAPSSTPTTSSATTLSAASSTLPSSQLAQSRNAILVSHRQVKSI